MVYKSINVIIRGMKSRPLILAVETSGRAGSVALASGAQLLAEADLPSQMRHSAELLSAVHALLGRLSREPAEIEHLYISIGPGSFTGLRIAATLAKTMHLANAARIVAVDTLDVIAANANDFIKNKNARIKKIAAILDAKRSQFFIAVYEGSGWVKSLEDCLMSAEQFLSNYSAETEPIWLLGEGLVYYRENFQSPGIRFIDKKYWTPKAAKVHLLGWQKALAGEFADPLTLQPKYLRKPDVL